VTLLFLNLDQDTKKELFRDFPQLKHLGAHAFRNHRLSGVVWHWVLAEIGPLADSK
jgi:hypothetical protein